MNLIQERPGCYWQADDPAGLRLNESRGPAPDTVTAFRIGHSSINAETTRYRLNLEGLEYIGKASFGPARGKSQGGAGWTADYLNFAIYLHTAHCRRQVVIMQTDGGGTKFYVVDDLDTANTWPDLIALLPEARLWDVCSSLVHSFHAGERSARLEERRAFLEGRMKKRRRGGRSFVEVIQAAAATLALAVLLTGCSGSSPTAPSPITPPAPVCRQVFHPETRETVPQVVNGQLVFLVIIMPAWTETVCE